MGPASAASAPGEGFAELLHQRELLRAREDPAAEPVGRRVDAELYVGQQLRHVLHLIEQRGAVLEGAQEAVRVGDGEVPLQRIVEADVPVALGDLVAQKGGLAALPRPGDEHGGKRVDCRRAWSAHPCRN